MALSASTVWEVRTGGSDNNGGAFVTGASGVDRSLQDAAHATLTTLSLVHTTTTQINVSLTDFTVSADDVGNILQITGGSATAGFYQITAVDVPNNRWTVDRSAGTAAQTVVGATGGALASPGKIGGVTVSGNIIYIKAGTYTITTASQNVSNGTLSNLEGRFLVGYSTNRTLINTDTQPILKLDSGVSSATILTAANLPGYIYNLELDGNAQTTSRGIASNNNTARAVRCTFKNFTNSASTSPVFFCYATGNSTTTVFTGPAYFTEGYANTVIVFSSNPCVCCLARENTGGTTDGFQTGAGSPVTWIGCVSYGNGRDGFSASAGGGMLFNSIATNNARYGINFSASAAGVTLQSNATYNNTSGNNINAAVINQELTTLSGDPFVNAASGDFALNNTAGAGADIRAAGFPSTFPTGLTANYLDIGAAQHQDVGGPVGASLRGGFING